MNIIGYAAFKTISHEGNMLHTELVRSEATTREAAELDFLVRYGADVELNCIMPLVDAEITEL